MEGGADKDRGRIRQLCKERGSRGGDRRGAGGGDRRYRIRSGRTYEGVVGDGGGRRGIELR